VEVELVAAPITTEPPTLVVVPAGDLSSLDEVGAMATRVLDEVCRLARSGAAFQIPDAAGRLHSFPAGFGPQGEQMSGLDTVPDGLGRARRTAERLNRGRVSASLQVVGETIQVLFVERNNGCGEFAMGLALTFLGMRDSPSDKALRSRLLAPEPGFLELYGQHVTSTRV
jgi:hypothetical protein